MIRLLCVLWAFLFCVSLAGCGPAEEPMLPVQGQITLDGKPLTKGTISFHPDVDKGNKTQHLPHGAIDSKGRYKMTTHPRDGAPAGWYKVVVVATEPSDPNNPYAVPRSLIPEKFANPEESGLAIEVRPNAPVGAYDLDLK